MRAIKIKVIAFNDSGDVSNLQKTLVGQYEEGWRVFHITSTPTLAEVPGLPGMQQIVRHLIVMER